MSDPLLEILRRHKGGEPVGIYAVCSANRYVLDAAVQQAKEDESPLLVEATCNQANQFGGYTGMTPRDFAVRVREMACAAGLKPDRLVLGGDHLGPSPWLRETAAAAMDKARVLVRDFVRAGFTKIHLDASMRCADDPGGPQAALDPRLVARRAAELCAVAEREHANCGGLTPAPCYIIGTEVPTPGGAVGELHELVPTSAEHAMLTIEATRSAFADLGLDAAWERVVALVVQPGVEFDDTHVIDYRRERARGLARLIEQHDGMVYEAHSTDYQTPEALGQLVEDHFAILKVGPWLTFALREAVFSLEEIERELLEGRDNVALSGLGDAFERAMLSNPAHWQHHYQGSQSEQRRLRRYSFSDRIRYFWTDPRVEDAVVRLVGNLSRHAPPLTLLSQYMPAQYEAVRRGIVANAPEDLIRHAIMCVTGVYARSTRVNRQPAPAGVGRALNSRNAVPSVVMKGTAS